MKKIKALAIAVVMMVSFVFIGEATASSGSSVAQDKAYYKTKRGGKKVYSKGKWVTKTTWRNGKRISKKVWVKGNSIGHKTGRGVKRVFTGSDRRRP